MITKLISYIFILVGIAIILSQLEGCAFHEKVLVNPSGQKYTCKTNGYGIIGTLVSFAGQNECEKEANEKGYK